MKKTAIILIVILFITSGCGYGQTKMTNNELVDKEEEISEKKSLTDKLKPIRENFKRINSVKDWSLVDEKELWETFLETLEGGEAKFYYYEEQLEKIVTHQFGETFQVVTEYYLLNGEISFVFRKLYRYNRPMYYDLIMMKENNDDEMFDFDKSEVIEDRCYFENGELIHHLKKQSGEISPFHNYYDYEGEKRIETDFEELIRIAKKK